MSRKNKRRQLPSKAPSQSRRPPQSQNPPPSHVHVMTRALRWTKSHLFWTITGVAVTLIIGTLSLTHERVVTIISGESHRAPAPVIDLRLRNVGLQRILQETSDELSVYARGTPATNWDVSTATFVKVSAWKKGAQRSESVYIPILDVAAGEHRDGYYGASIQRPSNRLLARFVALRIGDMDNLAVAIAGFYERTRDLRFSEVTLLRYVWVYYRDGDGVDRHQHFALNDDGDFAKLTCDEVAQVDELIFPRAVQGYEVDLTRRDPSVLYALWRRSLREFGADELPAPPYMRPGDAAGEAVREWLGM